MCRYCDLVSGDAIDIGDNKNQTLYIERHNNNFSISTENDEVDINYCPMCGRKLAEDGRNKAEKEDNL